MTDIEKMLVEANGVQEEVYPSVVSALIRKKYTLDAEFALINNYNADPELYGQKYAQYQALRAECKARAKVICGLEVSNG